VGASVLPLWGAAPSTAPLCCPKSSYPLTVGEESRVIADLELYFNITFLSGKGKAEVTCFYVVVSCLYGFTVSRSWCWCGGGGNCSAEHQASAAPRYAARHPRFGDRRSTGEPRCIFSGSTTRNERRLCLLSKAPALKMLCFPFPSWLDETAES